MEINYQLDNALLNWGQTDMLWGNLGYWLPTATYPQAAKQLAVTLGQIANLQPTDHVLDVGCGYGDQLFVWHEQFRVAQIVGIEIEWKVVQAIQHHLKKRGLLTYIKPHYGSATELQQFKPASFDKILSLDSAYHYHPRRQFFASAYQLLKIGGCLALTDIILTADTPPIWRRWLFQQGAILANIPPENMVTLTEYYTQLADIGFKNIHLIPIEAHVFRGFSHFMAGHWLRHGWYTLHRGWQKPLMTALAGALLARCQWLHYVIIRADKG